MQEFGGEGTILSVWGFPQLDIGEIVELDFLEIRGNYINWTLHNLVTTRKR